MSSYNDLFWQLRELQRIIDQYRPQLALVRNSLQGATDRLALLEDRYLLPPSYLYDLQRFQEAIAGRSIFSNLVHIREQFDEYVREIEDSQQRIANTISSTIEASFASSRYIDRIAESLASTEVLLAQERLSTFSASLAIQIPRAFQVFAAEQASLAGALSSLAASRRALAVDAASELLQSAESGLRLGALMNRLAVATPAVTLPEVNLFAELSIQLDAVDLEAEELDVEELILESPPAAVATHGERIVKVVYNLNIEAERAGRPLIFKPTTKLMLACSVIPTRLATDEQSFGEVIDQLYFLLYEGSGAAKRLTERASDSGLAPLWRLKHLRLGARHDVDHGDNAEKKKRDVGVAFQALVGKVQPRSPQEWRLAQVELLRQLAEMLEDLWFGDDDDGG